MTGAKVFGGTHQTGPPSGEKPRISGAIPGFQQAAKASAPAYDLSGRREALETVEFLNGAAVTACNLVHDTRRMRSIFSQLGIKENIQYVSSGRASPGPKTHSILSLTVLAIAKHEDGSRSAESVPMLDQCIAHRAMRAVDFDTWWVKEMVWQSPEKIILNRCGLVTSMRDQDGGAHLDSELKHPGYISSSKENQWWWLDSKGQPLAPMFTYDHFAIMRQIAWELQKTLQDNADKLML